MHDIIIIGKGPAGISAALYGCRANLSVVVIGKDNGSLAKAGNIENYYGFDVPVSGTALVTKGIQQAKMVGALVVDDEVLDIEWDGQFKVKTKNEEFVGRSLIIATGSNRRKADVKGLEFFEGKGISYCAVCDGFFFRGKDIAVLGNGEYALQEVKDLLPLVQSVTLLSNGAPLTASFPESVKIIETPIQEIFGEKALQGVRFADESIFSTTGIFVALGSASATDLARKIGAEIRGTSIAVDGTMATNVPGLFAAGDCIGGTLQVAVAVGDGAKAALTAISYVRKQKREERGEA